MCKITSVQWLMLRKVRVRGFVAMRLCWFTLGTKTRICTHHYWMSQPMTISVAVVLCAAASLSFALAPLSYLQVCALCIWQGDSYWMILHTTTSQLCVRTIAFTVKWHQITKEEGNLNEKKNITNKHFEKQQINNSKYKQNFLNPSALWRFKSNVLWFDVIWWYFLVLE